MNKKITLASKSPRRNQLLKELGFPFEIRTKETDEDFPKHLVKEEIPLYLCEHKANAFNNDISKDEIIITADTIVWVDDQVLNKPQNKAEAIEMLNLLSGKMHEVITGVCIKSLEQIHSFYVLTKVYFRDLKPNEIEHYIDNYKPYDKAGGYGIQEWIGLIGIDKIEGSYFNVVGFPTNEVYTCLKKHFL